MQTNISILTGGLRPLHGRIGSSSIKSACTGLPEVGVLASLLKPFSDTALFEAIRIAIGTK
ncbi:MAG: hypothetical protein JWM11_4658 [Planctomycetaceae bacterium]|nr:hypothetical protein [Planctomycetaceae bacterium]